MDHLSLIAELGIAFAGFVAIFLIFARRDGRFSAADSLRVRSIILSSLGVVFIVLAPLLLHSYGLREVLLWRTASTIGLAVGLPTGLNVGARQLRMSVADNAEVGAVHTFVSWGLFLLAFALLSTNALGLFFEPTAWPFLTASACILGIATSNFITIAFQRLL